MIVCKCGKVLDATDPGNVEEKTCLKCVLKETPGSLPMFGQNGNGKPPVDNQLKTSAEAFIDVFESTYLFIVRLTLEETELKGKYVEFGLTRQQLNSALKQLADRKKEDEKQGK